LIHDVFILNSVFLFKEQTEIKFLRIKYICEIPGERHQNSNTENRPIFLFIRQNQLFNLTLLLAYFNFAELRQIFIQEPIIKLSSQMSANQRNENQLCLFFLPKHKI
jgi:hypothetical protein